MPMGVQASTGVVGIVLATVLLFVICCHIKDALLGKGTNSS